MQRLHVLRCCLRQQAHARALFSIPRVFSRGVTITCYCAPVPFFAFWALFSSRRAVWAGSGRRRRDGRCWYISAHTGSTTRDASHAHGADARCTVAPCRRARGYGFKPFGTGHAGQAPENLYLCAAGMPHCAYARTHSCKARNGQGAGAAGRCRGVLWWAGFCRAVAAGAAEAGVLRFGTTTYCPIAIPSLMRAACPRLLHLSFYPSLLLSQLNDGAPTPAPS